MLLFGWLLILCYCDGLKKKKKQLDAGAAIPRFHLHPATSFPALLHYLPCCHPGRACPAPSTRCPLARDLWATFFRYHTMPLNTVDLTGRDGLLRGFSTRAFCGTRRGGTGRLRYPPTTRTVPLLAGMPRSHTICGRAGYPRKRDRGAGR